MSHGNKSFMKTEGVNDDYRDRLKQKPATDTTALKKRIADNDKALATAASRAERAYQGEDLGTSASNEFAKANALHKKGSAMRDTLETARKRKS